MLNGKRIILISLCGSSPAVITETVHSLANDKTPIVPDELVVITTTTGQKCIEKELLDSGVWDNLLRTIKVQPSRIKFGKSAGHIRLIPDIDGKKDIEDLSDERDNEAASNYILATLRQFTEDPGCIVLFSIAGGRKTMSAYGALAMSMLGREKDMLCHVLVDPPFESPTLSPKFYFPDPKIKRYRLNGKTYNSSMARVRLTQIPFPRLRNLFRKSLGDIPSTFSDTVRLANMALNPDKAELKMLEIKPRSVNGNCLIGDLKINLSPLELALYWMLALRCKKSQPPVDGQKSLLELFLPFARAARLFDMSERNITDDDLRKTIHSISTKIKNASGHISRYYLPSAKKGVYSLSLNSVLVKCPDVTLI